MKRKFSTAWKASKQPRKQRKYLANAPLHLKRKQLAVTLSKELRKKQGVRNIEIRKNDTVRVIKGKFKKKQGKVTQVNTKKIKIYVEGVQIKKIDGSMVNVPLKPANIQIIELNLDDKKRMKKINTAEKNTNQKVRTKEKKNAP